MAHPVSGNVTPDKKKIKLDKGDFTDVCGYIHNVSPIKISEKNNNYFTCNIQRENEVNEMVCLSAENWKCFQRAEREDSAVVVKNVRCQLENRRNKLFTNYMTSIVNVTEPLAFEKRQQLTEEIEVKNITIEDVYVKPFDVCGFYSLSGKVISVGKSVEIMVYGNRKNCQDVVITDGVFKLNVSLFGTLIGKIEKGRSYRFINVALRKINNIPKVTVRKQTTLEEIGFELLGDTYDVGKNDEDGEKSMIDISGVKCDLKVKCPCCNHDVNYDAVKHMPTVRCDKCAMVIKTVKLISSTITRVDGQQQNGDNQKLIIQNWVMKDYLVKISKEHLL